MNIIPKSLWHICKITGKSIQEIYREYGGKSGIYRTKTFEKYLLAEHNLSVEQYFLQICQLSLPVCPCGCGKKCKINKKRSTDFKFSDYACGNNPGVVKWSKEAKALRLGKNNPMYGKTPWNLGKTKFNDERVLQASQKILRVHQKRLRDNPSYAHLEMRKILNFLTIRYEEEFISGYWIFDFKLIDYNVFMEVDGDYYHCNPIIYKNGPINTMQKNRIKNDFIKNEYCKSEKINLIRFWEYDIKNNTEKIKCILKKLLK